MAMPCNRGSCGSHFSFPTIAQKALREEAGERRGERGIEDERGGGGATSISSYKPEMAASRARVCGTRRVCGGGWRGFAALDGRSS